MQNGVDKGWVPSAYLEPLLPDPAVLPVQQMSDEGGGPSLPPPGGGLLDDDGMGGAFPAPAPPDDDFFNDDVPQFAPPSAPSTSTAVAATNNDNVRRVGSGGSGGGGGGGAGSAGRTSGVWDDDDDDDDPSKSSGALTATALYDWEAQAPDQISFVEGEVIEVLDRHESGWWWGRTLRNESGCFPHNYVELSTSADAGASDTASKAKPVRPPPPKLHQRGASMKVGELMTGRKPSKSRPGKLVPSVPSTVAEEASPSIIKEGMVRH